MAASAPIDPAPPDSPPPAKAIRRRVESSAARASKVVRSIESALVRSRLALEESEIDYLRAQLAHKGAELRAQKRIISELEQQLDEITEDRLIDAKAVEEFELENRKLKAALDEPPTEVPSSLERARIVHEGIRLLIEQDRSYEGPWELASTKWRKVLVALLDRLDRSR